MLTGFAEKACKDTTFFPIMQISSRNLCKFPRKMYFFAKSLFYYAPIAVYLSYRAIA